MKIAEVLPQYPTRLWALSKQVGVTHVVGRLPRDTHGNVSFEFMDLLHMKKRYEDFGLKLEVLEPGLEWKLDKVRLGVDGRDEEIAQCQTLIRHMGTLGIPVLCYNFMPVFNWIRTALSIPERGGALVTGYDHENMKNAPSTEAGLISEDQLWENLRYFLKKIVPVAEEAKVKLSLHPDDPPVSPIRGLSRIITSANAIQQAISLVPSEYSGVTFCQGTLATAGENIPETIKHFGRQGKIFYLHFRDIRGNKYKFHETFHDNGQTNMLEAIQTYKKVGFDGPVRVDHVPTLEGENNQDPGYESMGRLFAIGYLKGLLEGATS
jgi:mannonate dehydratase